jgi:CubicO group peptidase (beta-lactamase class C family)
VEKYCIKNKEYTIKKIAIGFGVLVILLAIGAVMVPSQQASKFIKNMDLDKSGTLEFVEVGPVLRREFGVLDLDSSGSMDQSEVASYIRELLVSRFRSTITNLGKSKGVDSSNGGQPESIAELVERMVSELELTGAVLITGRNGVERFRTQTGDIESTTVIPVASASKWISSAVIMKLVERGQLDLDAPINNYLPSSNTPWASVTLRQMLSHSSGAQLGHAIEFSPEATYESAATELLAQALRVAPGTEFAYGGVSMQIAGYLAEKVSKESWQELFENTVASPAGMTASYFGHPFWDKPGAAILTPNISGGLHSTADDYFRFLSVLTAPLDNQGMLFKSSIAEMETDHSSDLAKIDRGPGISDTWSYGLGLWCEKVKDDKCMLLNSAGAFGTFPWINRETGDYGVLITVGSIKDVLPYAFRLRELVEAKSDW